MSNKLYANDMLVAEVPDADMIVPSSLPPNAIIYHSSVTSMDYLPWSSTLLHRTNCCNCGAPLPSNGKCIYCDTENDREVSEEQSNARSETNITATGITFSCFKDKLNPYMESVAVRDAQGRLHRKVVDLRE